MKVTIAPQCPPEAVVFEYGVRLDKECLDPAMDQFRKAQRLYNNLIACERLVVDQLRAFVLEKGGEPAAAAQVLLANLSCEFDSAKARNDEAALKAIAQHRRAVWHDLAAVTKEVRARHRAEIQTRFLSRIGRNSACDTYAIRTAAVSDGLGWATANAVLDAAMTAFKRSFALGRAPRFSRATDKVQECLTLQFTTAGGVPALEVLSGQHCEFSLMPSNGCGKRRYGEFRFRLGNAGAQTYATGTWQYHRAVPDDSRLASARLVRRRIGKDQKWYLQLVVKLARPIAVPIEGRKALVAVHFGWSADPEGRRVAGIADSADPGLGRLVRLPPAIEEALRRAAAIQSGRHSSRDQLVPMLRELDVPSMPDPCREELLALRRLAVQHFAISRLHRLHRLLRESGVAFDWFDQWRSKDRMAWQSTAHIGRRARLARRDYYRHLAIDLARRYAAIVIEPLALAEAAQKINETTGDRSPFGPKARSGRVLAAIHELDHALRWAANKCACAVLELKGKTVQTCAFCGNHTDNDEEGSGKVHCAVCGAETDRKLNGAANAWVAAEITLESSVAEYHIEVLDQMRKKGEAATERKVKLAAGRRLARTRSDGGTADGSLVERPEGLS